jgi:thymidylate synthase
MTGHREPGESYTYGERLTKAPLTGKKLAWWKDLNADIVDTRKIDGNTLFEKDAIVYMNQIEWVIETYKNLVIAITRWCYKWPTPRIWRLSIHLV